MTAIALIVVAALSTQQDTLPVRHRPQGNTISLDAGQLRALAISSRFTYVGAQRFILNNAADAEQHLFVQADSQRVVQRLYWIQLEELLPSRTGAYNYSADSVTTNQGFALRANLRTYTAPPAAGSDRARAFTLLERRGYRIPEGSTRVRLIYLPEHNPRREVMIIYLEAPAATAEPNERALANSLIARALGDLVLRASR